MIMCKVGAGLDEFGFFAGVVEIWCGFYLEVSCGLGREGWSRVF